MAPGGKRKRQREDFAQPDRYLGNFSRRYPPSGRRTVSVFTGALNALSEGRAKCVGRLA